MMISLLGSVCLIALSGFQGSAGESISAEKCKEYSTIFQNSCNDRVFLGGRNAKLGEFPYMAALKFNETEGSKYLCTGALISKNFVLAPAYCLRTRDLGQVVAVKLGQININEKTPAPSEQEIKVQEIIAHPDYNPQNRTNVIGLIKLENDVVFSKDVNPICLNDKDVKVDTFISSGWNHHEDTDDKEQFIGLLLKNMLTAFTPEECKKMYTSRRSMVTDDHVCVGLKKHGCDAQPIGTLQVENKNVPCMDTLVGIVNFGKVFCSGNRIPDVYTKIHPYLSWIESIVWA